MSDQTIQQPSRDELSVYVGGLHSSVTEKHLSQKFEEIGGVTSVHICRDAGNGVLRGHGYVNFSTTDHVTLAIQKFSYTKINDKPCHVMPNEPDSTRRESSEGNLFVKNIHKSVTDMDLREAFANYGEIRACIIERDEEGKSTGVGYVHFENVDDAKSALEEANGMKLGGVDGKNIKVSVHMKKAERQAQMDEERKNFTRVFVNKLNSNDTKESVKQIFESVGGVEDVKIEPKGIRHEKFTAIVDFVDHAHAVNAIKIFRDGEHERKELFVNRYLMEDEIKRRKIYIKNLDKNTEDAVFEEKFGTFGTITRFEIKKDEKGDSKGFGFVWYSNPDEATMAIKEMHKEKIGSKPVYVSLASPSRRQRNPTGSATAKSPKKALGKPKKSRGKPAGAKNSGPKGEDATADHNA